jgi:micrococcal nuclease
MYIAPPSPSKLRSSKQKFVTPAMQGAASLVSVGDGDTIRVEVANGQKATIRLACIDAPETAQGESGAQATAYLKQLLAFGSLEIQPQTVDRYGRTVAEVFADGRNVNLEMVRGGQAYAYRDFLDGCDASAYLDAESQAERTRQGVWRWGDQQRPWEFRRQSR